MAQACTLACLWTHASSNASLNAFWTVDSGQPAKQPPCLWTRDARLWTETQTANRYCGGLSGTSDAARQAGEHNLDRD